jgi:hypothetical protein
VVELLLTEAALGNLGARAISSDEPRQLLRNAQSSCATHAPLPRAADPRFVEVHRADPNATVRIVVRIEGEDARRLQRLSSRAVRSRPS